MAETNNTYNNNNADGNGDRSTSNNVSGVDGMQDSGDEVTSSKTNIGGEAESTNVDVAERMITYNKNDTDGNGDRSTSNNVSGVDGIQRSEDEVTSSITKCVVTSDDHKV